MLRRQVLLGLALLALLPLPAAAQKSILYAGSYTSGTSKGIYAWRFDSDNGSLAPIGLVAATPQPAHVWASPNGKFLYAVNWEDTGGVSAFRIDPATGGLTFLNRVSSHGAKPNQVMTDPSGRILATVNYATGNVSAYTIREDGSLTEAVYTDQHTGGPQSAPKAHGIEFSRDGTTMYIAELGLDRVYSYHVDAGKGTVSPADPAYTQIHAGGGPRRVQIAPNGKYLYVNHETDAEVSVFAIDDTRLNEVQTISTLPAGYTGANKTAEIIISPDNRFLYVSNRGHDSIAVFAIDKHTGRLSLSEIVPAGGRTPRNLRLDPTGKYLLSANEGSGTITVFRIDRRTGLPVLTATQASIDTPGGLYFIKSK